jgi:hypothetical protein
LLCTSSLSYLFRRSFPPLRIHIRRREVIRAFQLAPHIPWIRGPAICFGDRLAGDLGHGWRGQGVGGLVLVFVCAYAFYYGWSTLPALAAAETDESQQGDEEQSCGCDTDPDADLGA